MRGSSIALIEYPSRDRAQTLSICKDTYGEGMLSSINIVCLGETSQGCWTSNGSRRSTAGCFCPINIRTRMKGTLRIIRSYLPSKVIFLDICWQMIHGCARLCTRAVEVNITNYGRRVIVTTRISISDIVYRISHCSTIGWGSIGKSKSHRIGVRPYVLYGI